MSEKVLIVEDQVMIALDYEDLVTSLGYEVIALASTREHVQKFARKAEIALVDLNLADGMSGIEIGRSLAEQHGVSVIFATATPEQLGENISGLLGYITKPVSPELLAATLKFASACRRGDNLAAPPPGFTAFGHV